MKWLLIIVGAAIVVNLKVFDCYTVPAGNLYAGQKSCRSLLSKWVGPL